MSTRVRFRFVAAFLVSVLAHALVITRTWVLPPDPEPERQLIEARLAPAPVPEIVPRLPAPRRPAARSAPVVAAATPLALPLEPEPPAAEAPPAEPAPVATAPASTFVPEAAPPRSLPRRGRITYTLLYGNDRSPVGKAVQSWVVEADAYTLSSEAETTGVVEFFRPQRMRYTSQGKITPQGLRPESFLMSRTRRGQTESAQARFDWGAGNLTYGSTRDPKSAALPAGAQDFMSFIYHYALAPPAPGRYRVPVTTGSRFDVYEVEVSAEASIETPIGALKALPVKQLARAGQESIEVWLAAEYRYLPVRIRHYDREGNPSGEQMVSEIRISED